jgi:hypothetical protein
MTTPFFHLDTAIRRPAQERNSPEDLLIEKQYLYAALNSVQASSRLNELNIDLAQLINESELTIGTYNKTIESYLVVLLDSSTISNLNRDKLSPHFELTKLITSKSASLDPSYLESIMFTSSKTWGTSFGTLGYFLHEGSYIEHYKTPSQLVNQSLEYLALSNKDETNSQFLAQLIDYSLSDSIQSDTLLYKLSIDFLNLYKNISSTLDILRFFKSWFPRAINLILEDLRTQNFNKNFKSENSQKAYEFIKEATKKAYALMMDETSFKDIEFRFMHNELPFSYFQLLEEMQKVVATSKYSINSYEENPYEDLAKELLEFKVEKYSPDLIRQATSTLTNLFYPGGYNLLLTSLAAALINKVYILTHSSNIDKTLEFNKSSIDPDNLGRWSKLLFMAGVLLKKSNIYNLNVLGSNLVSLSFVPNFLEVQITDLTQ